MEKKFYTIGKRVSRKFAVAKATGAIKYTNDIYLPRMLSAKILRSPYPHAKVKKIDTSEAEKLSGVKAVITYKDVPKEPLIWASFAVGDTRDSYILKEKARYVGDTIAAVAATNLDIVEKAIELIDVKYEELPAVFDPIEAMEPDAPLIHEAIMRWVQTIKLKSNIVGTPGMAVGDVEKGFKVADLIVEEEYNTQRQLNFPLEPRATVCVPEPDGRLSVWSSTQSIHNLRACLSASLGMPLQKIKVNQPLFGGSFGQGIHMNINDPICALLALKTGLPVKLGLGRKEVAYENHRHSLILKLKMGVKRDGTLTAQEMKVIDDTGAYAVFGEGICLLVLGFFFSHCKCPNTKFDGYTVYTNTAPACAMRGVGNQSVNLAVMSHMDMIAEELGIDLLDLILKNFKGEGDLFYGQGPTITCTIKSCGSDYLVRKGAELIGWNKRKNLSKEGERFRRGIGMALGFHTSGAGTRDRASGILETTGAIVVFNDNGTATLNVALTERGTGNLTALAQIAAEELGIEYEDVIVLSEPSTDYAPYNYMDHASRSVYAVGGIVKAAAADAKKKLLKWAAKKLKVSVDELEVKGRQIYVNGSPKATVSEVTQWANSPMVQLGTIIGSHSGRPVACPPSFVTYFVEVAVDMETGETKVVKAVAGADVGTVINPDGLEAQLGGGLHMGLGYALTEELCIDEATGKILNPTPTDYKMLTSSDMPELKTFFADTVEPTGPFGAKGVGEAAFNPVASAVANAVYNATGIRFRELPITPEKILRVLKDKEKQIGRM